MRQISFTGTGVKKLPISNHFDTSTPAFGMGVGKNRRTWIVQRGADRRLIRVRHYLTNEEFGSLNDFRSLNPTSYGVQQQ